MRDCKTCPRCRVVSPVSQDLSPLSCYELYDRPDRLLAARLGLKPLKQNRRRALCGLPERLFGRYLARLLGLGRSVLVVRQGEQHWTGIRARVLAWRMAPAV